jgi:hypothetical protein
MKRKKSIRTKAVMRVMSAADLFKREEKKKARYAKVDRACDSMASAKHKHTGGGKGLWTHRDVLYLLQTRTMKTACRPAFERRPRRSIDKKVRHNASLTCDIRIH